MDSEIAAAEAAYSQALSKVQAAAKQMRQARSTGQTSSEQHAAELQSAQNVLARCKAALKAIKKSQQSQIIDGLGSRAYWAAQPDSPAWAAYPSPCDLPMNMEDPRWTMSFDPVYQRTEAREFWDEWGFVVFHDVIGLGDCRKTVDEIWDSLEARHMGLCRRDPSTFHLLPASRYGLPDEQAIFTAQIVRNRQSPRIYAALDCITPPWPPGSDYSDTDNGSPPAEPGPNSIRVSQDRWCLYPPSLGNPTRQTTNPGAHLDI